MRVNEPSRSFFQFLPTLPETLDANPGTDRADSLSHPSAPAIQAKAEDLDVSPAESLDPDGGEELSSIPMVQNNESTQNQCQVSETKLISSPKEMPILDNSSPPAEDKAFAWEMTLAAFPPTFSADAQPESPAEKSAETLADENYEEAIDLTSPEYSRESNNRSKEGFDPLEEVSLALFAWEDIGSQWTARNNKPPTIISTTFPSLFHQKVEETIGFFQTKGDNFFSRALGRSQAYEDMMKKILREKNLPEELFYLALVESGYNPKAFSRAKASGIWQFVTKTARRYGLKVDKWVDERRDPEKSTYAAAEYLKSLYEMFNNWDLVAASYNAGEGKILRAMKRAKSQDFWEISRHRYIRKETKKYVPMFLAAVLIASEPQKYGFSNIDYHPPLLYEKVMVPPATRLDLIAKASETDLSEIKALNPALKKEKTPPNCSQFEIKLPPGRKEIFEKNFPLLSQKAVSKGRNHSVRPGETLSAIAKKYRVHLQDLCQVNGLSPQARIKPGLILSVPR
jgi:hypothetical protein